MILPYLPDFFPYYVEPFCGNAPFLCPDFSHYIDPSEKGIWLNDLDSDVYNVMVALKHDPAFAEKFLARKDRCTSIAATKIEFERAKLDVRLDDDASGYLFLRRLACNQIVSRNRHHFCSLSMAYARLEGADGKNGLRFITRERLVEATAIMQQVDRVTNLDFREVLVDLPDGCVVYLDPPYSLASVHRMYDHFLTEADHTDLRDLLVSLDPSRHRWLMSLDISETSDHLYLGQPGVWLTTQEFLYATPDMGSRRHDEYLIANYPLY